MVSAHFTSDCSISIQFNIEICSDLFAVEQIPITERIPSHILERLGKSGGQNFISITRTDEEISIVYNAIHAPDECKDDRRLENWRCIKVRGPMDFGLYCDASWLLCFYSKQLATKVLRAFYAHSQHL